MSGMINQLDRLGALYERDPFVALRPSDIRDFLRAQRGRSGAQRTGTYMTLRDLAIKAGVPVGTVGRPEVDPEHVGLEVLGRIAAAHGYDIAVVFYRADQQQGKGHEG